MCGGGSKSPDRSADIAAANAETARINAEKALAERKAEMQTMADKENQASLEAKAKSDRRMLLSKAAFGDEEEDDNVFSDKASTRADKKNTQSILKSVV